MAETNELILEFDLQAELVEPLERALAGDGPLAQMAANTLLAGLSVIEEQIVVRTPVNFGHLRGSITRGQIVKRGASLEGDVRTPSPYGLPVEYGRTSGKWPPRDAIELWVVRKGLAEAGTPEARNAAFLIARAIGQGRSKGTANIGALMFSDGLAAASPQVNQLWSKFLDDAVDYLARQGEA